MKQVLYFLLLLMFSISCGSQLEEIVEEAYPDGSPKVVKIYRIIDNQKELLKEIAYYSNHQERIEGEYKDGKRHGKWIYWYENGNKWSEGYFKEGNRNGLGIAYHENGAKYIEGTYDDGKRVGKWQFWDDKGDLLKEINYDED